jgi:aminoglycoside phosphotransferase (APT) family kinase protein
LDLSSGVWQLLRRLQQSPALRELALRAAVDLRGSEALIHGDLKPDNVLIESGRFRFLDLELAGVGPIVWDLAAAVGSMLEVWALALARNGPSRGGTQGEDAVPSLPLIMKAVDSFLELYRSASDWPMPGRSELSASLARWLAGRSLANCPYALEAPCLIVDPPATRT